MNIYRMCVIAISISIGLPSCLFGAAAAEQKDIVAEQEDIFASEQESPSAKATADREEQEKEPGQTTYKFHKRRPSTGKTHDIKKRHNRPPAIKIEPRQPVVINPQEVRLQQKEDTPVMAAIREHDYKKVEELIQNRQMTFGAQNKILQETPLMRAAEYGDYNICKLLIEKDNQAKRIDAKDAQGNTPLMYAVRGGHAPVVELLLQRDANLFDTNGESMTALMMAARRNYVDIIKVLLAHCERHKLTPLALKQVNNHGDTALQIAMQTGSHKAETLLLDHSGAIDSNALQLINAAKAGDIKQVKALLNNKVNVNYRYVDQTPLLAAVMGESPEAMLSIVSALLHAGANPNVTGGHGYTPLVIVAGRHFDHDWEVRGYDGPLFSAMQCKIIEALLTGGADIEGIVNGKAASITPLLYAIQNFNADVAELLIDKGANVGATFKGTYVQGYAHRVTNELRQYKNKQLFNKWVDLLFYVDLSLDPISKTPEGALLKAINKNDIKRVAELLAHKPLPNIEVILGDSTPLTLAIQHNNTAIMQELINAGVDVDRRDEEEGITPLMMAIDLHALPSALELLALDIDVNIPDHHKNTALMHLAAIPLHDIQSIEVLEALLGQDANVTEHNDYSKTARDIVQDNTNADPKIKAQFIKILKEAERRELEQYEE